MYLIVSILNEETDMMLLRGEFIYSFTMWYSFSYEEKKSIWLAQENQHKKKHRRKNNLINYLQNIVLIW